MLLSCIFLRKFNGTSALFSLHSFLLTCLLCLWAGNLSANYNTTVFDTPTAITLEKGEYSVDSFFYREGGLIFKFNIGISTFINLGGTEYVDYLIGDKMPQPHIPNISARIRFTDNPLDSYNFAIGFDSLFHGNFQPVEKKLYGAYFVYSQGFMMLDNPQIFSIGVRQPLLYEIIEPDLFASIYFNLFEYFHIAIEINGINIMKQYDYHFILNQVFIFRPVQEMALEFNLQMGFTNDPDPTRESKAIFSKGIRLYYQSFF